MTSAIPDNEINAELSRRLDGIVAGGVPFPFYVSRVVLDDPENYIFISRQTNAPEFNKCGDGWINTTELLVVVRVPTNTGSKALVNDAVQAVLTAIDGLSLPQSTGLVINRLDVSVSDEIVDATDAEIIYAKTVTAVIHVR